MNIGETELQAFADDRLEPAARAAVEAHLAAHPEEAARVQAYRAQNAALRAAFDPVLDEPVPERLQLRPPGSARRFAFAAGWVLAGAAAGWFGHALFQTRTAQTAGPLPRQAAVAHAVYAPEVRHPVEVGADQQEHLVNWLSKRLGTKLRVPLLTGEGYELVGGRLLPGEAGAVAQFMYQDGRGRRLTLYVSRLAGTQRDTAFRFSQEERVGVFYWVDGPLGYALSGELPKAELLDLATVVYKQLNP